MVESKQRGFTIIELMLFLGITGALFAALMFGVSANINQQRYRESVVGVSTLLQGQYSEVSNTRNDANLASTNDNSFACGTDGSVTTTTGSQKADNRGGSKCVLLGRAIQISYSKDTGASSIDIHRVVGCEPIDPKNPSPPATTLPECLNATTKSVDDLNDLDTLIAYNPKITNDYGVEHQDMEWNSTLNTADTKHDGLNASFLILRSPASGLLRVFTLQNGALPANLKDMLTSDAATTKLSMCVLGDSVINAKQSVTIDPTISGPDGVIVNQSDGVCS